MSGRSGTTLGIGSGLCFAWSIVSFRLYQVTNRDHKLLENAFEVDVRSKLKLQTRTTSLIFED